MRALPSYDEATALRAAPPVVVPEEYADANGHLNVRHHLALYDDAEWSLFDEFGAGSRAAEEGVGGMFALEQHLTYRREVVVGDEVAVQVRMLARDERSLHLVSYLVNLTRGEVAGSMEALEGYVSYATRRLTPWPATSADVLDGWIARDRALPWRPELSGSLAVRGQ